MLVPSTYQWDPNARIVVQRPSPCPVSYGARAVEIIPESCPASFRNGARNDFGIVPGLPRNPQATGQIWQTPLGDLSFTGTTATSPTGMISSNAFPRQAC